jgi:hypothetical protein
MLDITAGGRAPFVGLRRTDSDRWSNSRSRNLARFTDNGIAYSSRTGSQQRKHEGCYQSQGKQNKSAGIAAITHFTMSTTMDQKGMRTSVITTDALRGRSCDS